MKEILEFMKNYIRTTLLASMLLASVSVFAAQNIGIRIGPPPAPRVVRVVPRSPGPGYVHVDGYWYPVGNHYKWHDGYWTRAPYGGARWIAPRHDRGQFYQGYWEGDQGLLEHNHSSDRSRNRDFRP
jgi:hypothetical protein